MKLGLHISDFTWPEGPSRLGPVLADVATAADQAGFNRISVMDHFWQIQTQGPPEHEMLESYTTLGFLAGHTRTAKLLTMVTGATWRDPGLLAKIVTTLDVLSGGRAMLGIGAAWNEEESRGLGLFFPPRKERFERLQETLRICRQMFNGDDAPFEGGYFHLARTLNSPAPLSRPRIPILIGGGGEQKTLRLVAEFADACNLFPSNEVQHKLDVLKRHCDEIGRDYDEIEKTVMYRFDLGENGERVGDIINDLRGLVPMGFTVAHGMLRNAWDLRQYDIFAKEIIPAVEAL